MIVNDNSRKVKENHNVQESNGRSELGRLAENEEPAARSAENEEPAARSAENEEPAVRSVESEKSVGRSIENEEPTGRSAESEEPTGRSAESEEPVGQPDASGQTANVQERRFLNTGTNLNAGRGLDNEQMKNQTGPVERVQEVKTRTEPEEDCEEDEDLNSHDYHDYPDYPDNPITPKPPGPYYPDPYYPDPYYPTDPDYTLNRHNPPPFSNPYNRPAEQNPAYQFVWYQSNKNNRNEPDPEDPINHLDDKNYQPNQFRSIGKDPKYRSMEVPATSVRPE